MELPIFVRGHYKVTITRYVVETLFIIIERYVKLYILKAIKRATGTSVIFPINISLIHFVFVLTSVPNVGEHFTKT